MNTSKNPGQIARATAFLKSWLGLRYDQCDIPGFSIGVMIDGDLVLHEAYGFANVEEREKLTTDHLFRVASHSKTFTGIALMQLAEEKENFSIDNPVADYLPWLKKHQDVRFSQITCRQLLSHSAGVIRDGLDADCWQFKKPFPDKGQLESEILAANLVYDANTTMKYSNSGYGLLGLLIEAVSGMTYHDYVQQKIIDVLDLKNTGPEVSEVALSRLASGYARRESADVGRAPLDSRINTGALAAATGFYSNAADLCRYFSAHVIGSGKLLSDSGKKEMQRTQWPVTNSLFKQEYGLGVQVDSVGTRRVIGHAGGFPGMATRTLCDPASRTVVSCLTNCIDADPTTICRAVFAFLDHFQSCDDKSYRAKSHFEGRFSGLFADMQILAGPGEKDLIGFNVGSWTPLFDVESFEVVDQKTLKVVKANGFSCEGELIYYASREGAASINYGGMTLVSRTTKI